MLPESHTLLGYSIGLLFIQLPFVGQEMENPSVRWERKYVIGKGPTGEVYAAVNLLTHQPMVVKEIMFDGSSFSSTFGY